MSNSSIWPIDRNPIRWYHSGPEWTWKQLQWGGALHFLKHYLSLTISLFSVISRTLVVRGLTPLQRSSWCILHLQLSEFHALGTYVWLYYIFINIISISDGKKYASRDASKGNGILKNDFIFYFQLFRFEYKSNLRQHKEITEQNWIIHVI